MKKNILFIFGTRPEVIKLAPVILEMKKRKSGFNVIICNTEQQKELSNQTLKFFGLEADIKLDAMIQNQTLADVQTRIMERLSAAFENNKIDGTVIQGDTMSVFCGALMSFYSKTPVFHVEAGLRSYNLSEPFPEEALRQMVTRITDLHFAPTKEAVSALEKENVSRNRIILTGNTVIDALYCLSDNETAEAEKFLAEKNITINDKLVLVTVHRRENHGDRLISIMKSIETLAVKYSDHNFILPVHPNPNVRQKVHDSLAKHKNVFLTEPLDYPVLVCLMRNAKLILTDSGGIQEEAPAFGVPVLVMRYETERKEGVDAGFAKLVGADTKMITEESAAVLSKEMSESRIKGKENPYGDGHAAEYIVDAMDKFFKAYDN